MMALVAVVEASTWLEHIVTPPQKTATRKDITTIAKSETGDSPAEEKADIQDRPRAQGPVQGRGENAHDLAREGEVIADHPEGLDCRRQALRTLEFLSPPRKQPKKYIEKSVKLGKSKIKALFHLFI